MYPSEMRNEATKYAFGNELSWLRNCTKDLEYAAMIGAGPGVMGLALMEGNPNLNLLIIDIQTCVYARKHLDEAGFLNVGYVVSDSSEYGHTYAGPKLDLLVVDGDHTFVGVTRDIMAWESHMKERGLIFFHDYEIINEDHTNGVKKAVDLLFIDDPIANPGVSRVYRC